MMARGVAVWPVAVGVSGVAHVLVLAGLAMALRPVPPPSQPMPESRLMIAAAAVERSTAPAKAVAGDNATATTPDGGLVQGSNPVQTRAQAKRLPAAAAKVLVADGVAQRPAAAPSAVPPLSPITAIIAASAAPGLVLPAQTAAVQSVAPLAPAAVSASASTPPAERAALAPGPAATADLPPPSPRVLAGPALGPVVGAASLPSDRMTAALAWTGNAGPVDPLSLAAIQSFMRAGDIGPDADLLRDGIGRVLASVPCGRLQTTFDPATGTLDLRGHIPDEGLRAPVLAAIRDRIGAAIPVVDRVGILPRPQCGALAGFAATGLPQSTEQDTNPLVIGADAQVRDYRYAEGERLVLDLTAPDYPAYIHVDYFDAAGNVVHLQPNDVVPSRLVLPKTVLSVGQDAPGLPALALTVAPPFGQEIAVAFATSDPVLAGDRPMVEPAGPYLAYLTDRIAAARAVNPGFKGEWVYFFITTAPR